MEEILKLEREIERLQKKREDGVSQLCESSKQELQLRRDAEIKRMKKEASRKATELIDLLNFGGLDAALANAEAKAPAAAEVRRDASTCFSRGFSVSLVMCRLTLGQRYNEMCWRRKTGQLSSKSASCNKSASPMKIK